MNVLFSLHFFVQSAFVIYIFGINLVNQNKVTSSSHWIGVAIISIRKCRAKQHLIVHGLLIIGAATRSIVFFVDPWGVLRGFSSDSLRVLLFRLYQTIASVVVFQLALLWMRLLDNGEHKMLERFTGVASFGLLSLCIVLSLCGLEYLINYWVGLFGVCLFSFSIILAIKLMIKIAGVVQPDLDDPQRTPVNPVTEESSDRVQSNKKSASSAPPQPSSQRSNTIMDRALFLGSLRKIRNQAIVLAITYLMAIAGFTLLVVWGPRGPDCYYYSCMIIHASELLSYYHMTVTFAPPNPDKIVTKTQRRKSKVVPQISKNRNGAHSTLVQNESSHDNVSSS